MNVLHISNGYADSKVHSNLTRSLDDMGVEQTVYCPVREERFLGRNQFEGNHIRFVFSLCIRSWYKYVYHLKRRMLFRDMNRRIDLRNFDVIHAATLFSDGGLALTAHKKYSIPYIVTVRNTDINLYIKKLRHTYWAGREILLKASKIVFISRGEMMEFENSDFVKRIYGQIKGKIMLQPNGIEDFWLQHVSHELRGGHKVLYIGDFTVNKNVSRLAEAVLQLRKEGGYNDVKLIIVGGEKLGKIWKNDERLKFMVTSYPEAIEDKGRMYDKEKLLEVMRDCALFAMPSIHETFGLVYLEALSQNLPVVYTKGQGIDGLFDESVGIGVDAFSVDEIRESIRHILEKPEDYGNGKVRFNEFDWHRIAERYIRVYENVNQH